MKVCFLLNDVRLSGGVGVVLEHAYHLAADHGFETTVALKEDVSEAWGYRRLDGVRRVSLKRAEEERFDVAVATWWRTAYDLFRLKADRYAYFVQSMEDRFYPDGVDRVQAAITHGLPVSFITEAAWIADTLKQLRPETPCYYVRNGVAKDVFTPPSELVPRTSGPLRILVEGVPAVWFKGVHEALDAAAAMTRPREVTLVTGEPVDASEFPVNRVLGPVRPEKMAELYAESDVVLKHSRVEGMFGPPLEGFHRGATCVVSPVTGHEEYVRHGWNGVVTGWDDPRGAGRWLDVLAEDRRLLHFLRMNALKTAEAWPSWTQASTFLAAALETIRREPPPPPGAGGLQTLEDVKAASEWLRNERSMAEGMFQVRDAQVTALLETRAYRWSAALRDRVWKHPLLAPLRRMMRLLRR